MRQGWRTADGERFDCETCIASGQQEAMACPLPVGRGPFPPRPPDDPLGPVHVEMRKRTEGKMSWEEQVEGTESYQCPEGVARLQVDLLDTLTYLHDFGVPVGDWRQLPHYLLQAYRTVRWALFGSD